MPSIHQGHPDNKFTYVNTQYHAAVISQLISRGNHRDPGVDETRPVIE